MTERFRIIRHCACHNKGDFFKSKKDGQDQESLQSSTTPDQGVQLHNQTSQTRAKRSALSQRELRRAKYECENNLASKIKTDNSYVCSRMTTKSSLCKLEIPNGDLTSDSQEKADSLNNFFVSVFENEGNENPRTYQISKTIILLSHSIEITEKKYWKKH